MEVFVRTKPWKNSYTDASDEEGRQTPSTERRTLFAVAWVYLIPGTLKPALARMRAEGGQGYVLDYRHAACLECMERLANDRPVQRGCSVCRRQAHVDHVLWAEARGMHNGVHYYMIDVSPVIGMKAKDEHGDFLVA